MLYSGSIQNGDVHSHLESERPDDRAWSFLNSFSDPDQSFSRCKEVAVLRNK